VWNSSIDIGNTGKGIGMKDDSQFGT